MPELKFENFKKFTTSQELKNWVEHFNGHLGKDNRLFKAISIKTEDSSDPTWDLKSIKQKKGCCAFFSRLFSWFYKPEDKRLKTIQTIALGVLTTNAEFLEDEIENISKMRAFFNKGSSKDISNRFNALVSNVDRTFQHKMMHKVREDKTKAQEIINEAHEEVQANKEQMELQIFDKKAELEELLGDSQNVDLEAEIVEVSIHVNQQMDKAKEIIQARVEQKESFYAEQAKKKAAITLAQIPEALKEIEQDYEKKVDEVREKIPYLFDAFILCKDQEGELKHVAFHQSILKQFLESMDVETIPLRYQQLMKNKNVDHLYDLSDFSYEAVMSFTYYLSLGHFPEGAENDKGLFLELYEMYSTIKHVVHQENTPIRLKARLNDMGFICTRAYAKNLNMSDALAYIKSQSHSLDDPMTDAVYHHITELLEQGGGDRNQKSLTSHLKNTLTEGDLENWDSFKITDMDTQEEIGQKQADLQAFYQPLKKASFKLLAPLIKNVDNFRDLREDILKKNLQFEHLKILFTLPYVQHPVQVFESLLENVFQPLAEANEMTLQELFYQENTGTRLVDHLNFSAFTQDAWERILALNILKQDEISLWEEKWLSPDLMETLMYQESLKLKIMDQQAIIRWKIPFISSYLKEQNNQAMAIHLARLNSTFDQMKLRVSIDTSQDKKYLKFDLLNAVKGPMEFDCQVRINGTTIYEGIFKLVKVGLYSLILKSENIDISSNQEQWKEIASDNAFIEIAFTSHEKAPVFVYEGGFLNWKDRI